MFFLATFTFSNMFIYGLLFIIKHHYLLLGYLIFDEISSPVYELVYYTLRDDYKQFFK